MNERLTDFIIGLMRENSDAVGFIPATTIERRYIAQEQYISMLNRGKIVGYLLHGKPQPGGILTVAQAVVTFERRRFGYGFDAVAELIRRANQSNCKAIALRCASDLHSNLFWRSVGFDHIHTISPANRRKRDIHVYRLNLWPTLFDGVLDREGER